MKMAMEDQAMNSNVIAMNEQFQNEEFSQTLWSLADLPEVILVKIMEYLSLKDKYYLSVTCQTFYDLFNHPNLWKTVHINLIHSGRRLSRWQYQAVMPKTMCEIVKRFAHLFKNLSIELSSNIQPFDDSFVNLLKDLSQECRLESLSLQLGLLESGDDEIQTERNFLSNFKDVHLLTDMLLKAVRLKHLDIVSWPLCTGTYENNIFQTILGNEKLKSLQSLSLFYIGEKDQWTGRVPKLPTPEEITNVLSFLPNLTHISLRSPMLNDELIQIMGREKRRKLEKLRVLIMWSRANMFHDGFRIPEIEDHSWSLLKNNSSCLSVDFVIHIRIPFDELAAILKPEVPLSSLSILKYGQCGSVLIDSMTSKYAGSLNHFVSRCDSANCDAALLNLVKECKNLNHLVYHGNINYKTVIQMATYLKDEKRDMKVFELKERNIKTDDLSIDEVDDDIVIQQNNETQEYFIAGIQSWHYDEELHRKKLDMMIEYLRETFDSSSWNLLLND